MIMLVARCLLVCPNTTVHAPSGCAVTPQASGRRAVVVPGRGGGARQAATMGEACGVRKLIPDGRHLQVPSPKGPVSGIVARCLLVLALCRRWWSIQR